MLASCRQPRRPVTDLRTWPDACPCSTPSRPRAAASAPHRRSSPLEPAGGSSRSGSLARRPKPRVPGLRRWRPAGPTRKERLRTPHQPGPKCRSPRTALYGPAPYQIPYMDIGPSNLWPTTVPFWKFHPGAGSTPIRSSDLLTLEHTLYPVHPIARQGLAVTRGNWPGEGITMAIYRQPSRNRNGDCRRSFEPRDLGLESSL